MNASFSVEAVLVKTESSGSVYAALATAATGASFAARTEKKNIPRKRFVPPGDGRFFDGHH